MFFKYLLVFLIQSEDPANFSAEPVLESRVVTRSGLLERFVDPNDERNFGVRLTKKNGQQVWLEQPVATNPGEKTFRESLIDFTTDASEAVFVQKADGSSEVLGLAPRVFYHAPPDTSCSASARVFSPTPLSSPTMFSLSNLYCQRIQLDPTSVVQRFPLTQKKGIEVIGRDDQPWVSCPASTSIGIGRCEWNYKFPESPEAAAQVSALTFLWRVNGELMINGINVAMPDLVAKSWASNANLSSYDATSHTLFYGSGRFPDALDAFVVMHEWGHAFFDTLNKGIYGYEGQVIHEAIADYIPAHIFKSACFAPFDAQEVTGRSCIRDLNVQLRYPQDLLGSDFHHDGGVLSNALWRAESIIAPSVVFEMMVETMIRLSKQPTLQEFWTKFESTYSRMLEDRILLANHFGELKSIGRERGLTD